MLQSQWYEKLKTSGFDDKEQFNPRSDEPLLKEWESSYFHTHYHIVDFEIRTHYYSQAQEFLHNHAFPNPFLEHLWYLHSEGRSLRYIAEELSKRMDVMLFSEIFNKDKVKLILGNLKKDMKEYFERINKNG